MTLYAILAKPIGRITRILIPDSIWEEAAKRDRIARYQAIATGKMQPRPADLNNATRKA